MVDSQAYIIIKKTIKLYGFDPQLLRKWEKAGFIQAQRIPGNTRMFKNVQECSRMFKNVQECSRMFKNVS